ncbi:MAG: hypothetical protein ABIN36_03805 [Ferruginibacter sp.]
MNRRLSGIFLKQNWKAVEWKLLLFLLLFLDVKLLVKIAALIMIYILNPNFRFGFKIRHSRLPLFYVAVIIIAFANWLIYRYFTLEYSLSLITGIFFWALCILAIQQVKNFVEKTEIHILHNTLLFFFIINIVFSLLNLTMILFEIGIQNPFLYQGNYQKYFINTGDYIKGVSFDTSTANALINAFGVVYFLAQRKYLMVIGCMLVLLLTASNFTNVILVTVFCYLFVFKSNKDQKSVMFICIIFLVIFLAKFSPQNDRYILEKLNDYFSTGKPVVKTIVTQVRITDKPDSILNAEEKKEKTAQLYMDSIDRERLAKEQEQIQKGIKELPAAFAERPEILMPSIHSEPFQSKKDTTEFQKQLLSFMYSRSNDPFVQVNKYSERAPGKLVAFYQLAAFLKQHPQKIITGNGTGNFSSKLAFKTTGLKIVGSYPEKYIYVNNDFFANHFAVYTSFFTKPAASHSIMNSPASVYGQLLSEYGLIGLAAFLFFYMGYFYKRRKEMTYGIALFFILLSAFFVEYWFEQLSIVVLFELMIFIDIKQHAKTPQHE